MISSRHIIALTTLVVCFGCSSSGDTAPDRNTAGSGGTSGVAGGPGGKADDGTGAIGGAAGQGTEEPSLVLPDGCAPGDMRFECNPITNEGCDTNANEACEYGLDGYFTCYPAPNDVDEGGACNWEQGPFCSPSLTCDFADPSNPTGICRRHCCADEDCAAPERCQPFDSEFGTLGTCR